MKDHAKTRMGIPFKILKCFLNWYETVDHLMFYYKRLSTTH